MSDPLSKISEAIRGACRILVTSHPNPDGDAIGSTISSLLILEQLGKEVVVYNPDPVPERFKFLSGSERFSCQLPSHEPFDLTLVLDTSDDRMFAKLDTLPHLGQMVIIDHHRTVGNLKPTLIHRDPKAGAVGVLVYKLLKNFPKVKLDKEIAEALFCSLMSDTGSFRYQNTDAQLMRIAAELLEVGVDPWHISSSLYEERQRSELELLGRCLETLEVSKDGLSASLMVTTMMLEETGCSSDMIDGFINYARGIKGVEVAVLLRPKASQVRISLRSRGRVDVSQIALRMGGGGHHNAAGCTVEGKLNEIKERLFAEVSKICSGA